MKMSFQNGIKKSPSLCMHLVLTIVKGFVHHFVHFKRRLKGTKFCYNLLAWISRKKLCRQVYYGIRICTLQCWERKFHAVRWSLHSGTPQSSAQIPERDPIPTLLKENPKRFKVISLWFFFMGANYYFLIFECCYEKSTGSCIVQHSKYAQWKLVKNYARNLFEFI